MPLPPDSGLFAGRIYIKGPPFVDEFDVQVVKDNWVQISKDLRGSESGALMAQSCLSLGQEHYEGVR